MPDVFKVSTSNIIRVRQAEIDGIIYTVRNKGGGDSLDISTASSKMAKISKEIIGTKSKYQSAKTDEERIAVLDEVEVLSTKMLREQAKLEGCYASLFDDGGDQGKSKAMVHKYGIDGVENILQQIFGGEDGSR